MPQAQGTKPQGTKVRYTRQAAAVITVLSRMPEFGDAPDIQAAVYRAGRQVGLATVYRHLRVLAEQGRLDTIRGDGGRTLYRLRRDGLTHHLTCRACGRTAEVDGREIWEWARKVKFTRPGADHTTSGSRPQARAKPRTARSVTNSVVLMPALPFPPGRGRHEAGPRRSPA